MAGILDLITNKVAEAIGLNTSLPRRKSVGFDIQEFKSAISERGIAPDNLFLVTIYPKSRQTFDLMSLESLDERSLSFFCNATDLPGISLATEQNIRLGTGPVEYFPHSAIFNDIQLEFFGDAKGQIISFFHNWLNTIVKFDATKSYGNLYRVGYKDDYICTIRIQVFDTQTNQILDYRLFEAFPYILREIPMNWASQNNLMNFGVGFHYKTWVSDRLVVLDNGEDAGQLNTFQKLIKFGTIVQTASTMRRPQSIGDTINLVNNANIISGNLNGFF